MGKEAKWSAKTPAASFVALRKQKAFGNVKSSSLKPQASSQCSPSMMPQHVDLLIGRPNNHISFIKVLVLLSVVVLLFLNIISYLFNYPFLHPTILSFSSFAFPSNSTSPPPPPSLPSLNTYSHVNSSTSFHPSGFNISPSRAPHPLKSPQTISNYSHPILNTYPPPRQHPPPPDLIPFSHPPPPPPPPPNPPPLSPSGNPPPPPNQPPPLPSPPINHPPLLSHPLNHPLTHPTNLNTLQQPASQLHPNLTSGKPVNRKAAKGCDLSRGEWVRDWNAPYYTNMTCYTIQEHQNCMKYGRPNMDFLKWRWKPDGCELPLFDPQEFLELMRGKTLAFVGDSLARNQMQSLMCLLSRVVFPEDISENLDDNFKRMYYPAFNFTIRTFWSPFLIRAKQTRGPDRLVLWNFYLDEVDETWASHIDEFDHLIISGGNWFNRPSIFYEKRRIVGCLYCPSKKVTHRSMHYSNRMAFHTAFQAINKSNKFKGTVILRSVSPSHFENGVWDKGGNCVRTMPFQHNETNLSDDDLQLYKDQLDVFKMARTEGRNKGIDYRLLDSTNAMLLRPDGHPSRYGHWPKADVTLFNDCVHWCLPGPIDMWNDILLQMLSV